MPSQQILHKKVSEVQEVAQLIKKYKVIGIASLQIHAGHTEHSNEKGY